MNLGSHLSVIILFAMASALSLAVIFSPADDAETPMLEKMTAPRTIQPKKKHQARVLVHSLRLDETSNIIKLIETRSGTNPNKNVTVPDQIESDIDAFDASKPVLLVPLDPESTPHFQPKKSDFHPDDSQNPLTARSFEADSTHSNESNESQQRTTESGKRSSRVNPVDRKLQPGPSRIANIVSVSATVALILGAYSARRVMKKRQDLGGFFESDSIEDELAYDIAYTTGASEVGYGSFSSPWTGDLEKFDV